MSDDGFLGQRLNVLQPKKGYRAGIDAVMLAASIPAVSDDHVLDLGAGVGVASLCLAARSMDVRVSGLEIQPDLAETARQNAVRNGLSDRVDFVEGSVTEKAASLEEKKLPFGSFHHVMTNPPYFDAEKVWASPDKGKATAHAFQNVDLAGWVRVACAMARPKGTVTFVHRADALPELLQHIDGRLGALVAFPLWPAQGQAASRVLLQGVKGSRAPFTIAAGLVLHEAGGGFTPRASEILRDGVVLDLRSA